MQARLVPSSEELGVLHHGYLSKTRYEILRILAEKETFEKLFCEFMVDVQIV